MAEASVEAPVPLTPAVPLPRPRPVTEPPSGTVAWAASAEQRFRSAASSSVSEQEGTHPLDAIEQLAPLPRPRPASEGTELALVAPRALQEAPFTLAPGDPACLARLRELGVVFTEEPAIDPGGACNVDHPLTVTAVGQEIALEPAATTNCRTAEALARWAQEIVVPSARAAFSEVPAAIVQDSSYVCRPRNNVAGAKLSEHAHANAIDIAAFKFAKRAPASIGQEIDKAGEEFEAAIRSAACRYFTTVLGPGSNAAHATHFHFDLAERRHGYRLCELEAPAVARSP